MRQINEAISVTTSGGVPVAFAWRGSRKRVAEVADTWEEAGRWWLLEPEQTIYRVLTSDGGMFELARLYTDPPQWKMLVVWD